MSLDSVGLCLQLSSDRDLCKIFDGRFGVKYLPFKNVDGSLNKSPVNDNNLYSEYKVASMPDTNPNFKLYPTYPIKSPPINNNNSKSPLSDSSLIHKYSIGLAKLSPALQSVIKDINADLLAPNSVTHNLDESSIVYPHVETTENDKLKFKSMNY